MDRSLKPLDVVYGGSLGAAQQQRVLRNTYALLALSLVPTVLGAWIGMATGINSLFAGSPLISAVVFLAASFGFFYAIEKNKDSGLGVVLLLAFTFFMGLMLSRLVGFALGMEHGARAIGLAFGGTAAVFVGMATLAGTIKRDLSGMGKWMMGGAIVILVMGLANIWLKMPALHLALCAMAVVVFSAFMLYDIKRVMDGGETNYVSATLAIYLDVYNVFTSLVQIILSLTGNSDD